MARLAHAGDDDPALGVADLGDDLGESHPERTAERLRQGRQAGALGRDRPQGRGGGPVEIVARIHLLVKKHRAFSSSGLLFAILPMSYHTLDRLEPGPDMAASTVHRMLALLLAIMAVTVAPVEPARASPDFAGFLTGLWPDAAAAGVSRKTFDAAFAGVTPDPKVVEASSAQPEFNQTIQGYVASRVTAARIAEGQRQARRWSVWLDRAEQRYGVDRAIILAVWAMESNFGAGTGRADTIRSLASFACCTSQRPAYFRDELLAALVILEAHDIAPRAMTGSWAGAMGQTQFMPTSFLKYAVDADGDGRRDIWGSAPDAIASIARYLQLHDWARLAPWGHEVRLPAGFDFAAITAHEGAPVASWARLGLRRADGKAFDDDRARAWLLLPAGASGPAFLTLRELLGGQELQHLGRLYLVGRPSRRSDPRRRPSRRALAR